MDNFKSIEQLKSSLESNEDLMVKFEEMKELTKKRNQVRRQND